ncbi:MAG: ExbD/TolR family protein [Planctomycetota bacterium]
MARRKSKRRSSRRRGGEDSGLDVNVTSFADIAFLLLIFFLVVASIQPSLKGMDLEAPSGEKAETKEKTDTIQLNDGEIFFNEKKVSLAQLRGQLAAAKYETKKGQGKSVSIEVTGKVDYADFYPIFGMVKSTGGIPIITYEEDE